MGTVLRRGVTLIEVTVSFAVVALMISFLLPAVQKVREAAVRTQSRFNQKQITLALHIHLDTANGVLPSLNGNPKRVYDPAWRQWAEEFDFPLFWAILPYLADSGYDRDQQLPVVRTYVSPADPTITFIKLDADSKAISYPANANLFDGRRTLTSGLPDGTSNTFAFAEKYFMCGPSIMGYTNRDKNARPARRPSFADGGPVAGGKNPGDVYPVTDPVTGATRPSVPGVTFQARPVAWRFHFNFNNRPGLPGECDPALMQTPHAGGMLVALADGSVRTVSPGVAPEAFWAAVTPAAGDVAGDW